MLAWLHGIVSGLSGLLLWKLRARPKDADALVWWLLLCTVLATVAEAGIAAAWHAQIRWFITVHNSVSSRLWRGVAVPILAVLVVLLAAFPVYKMQETREKLGDAMLEKVWSAASSGVFLEKTWSVISFGVLFAALPMVIVITRRRRS